MARNIDKVKSMYFPYGINWMYQELKDNIDVDIQADYVIHTASPTDSKYFITNPVETINDTIKGLNVILDYSKGSKGVVFLSSMEVYGVCKEDIFLKENASFPINQLNVRNSYSEGKRILECICASYASEYNVPVKVVRLCQTFGPGIIKSDNRVFAQFGRSVALGKDIVLATKGETKRSYCSVSDALVGIICVLLLGKSGEAYNVASDDSYCSIYDMAQLFVENTTAQIIIEEQVDKKYLETIKFGLDTSKIKKLGFKSTDNIRTMVEKFKTYYIDLLNNSNG